MRPNFSKVRLHPDGSLEEMASTGKETSVRQSGIQSYIHRGDTSPQSSNSKKDLLFKMPMPKGSCPPSAIKTIPGSTPPDKPPSIANDSTMTTFSKLLATGVILDKFPSFANESTVNSNGNNNHNFNADYMLSSAKTQVSNQLAEINNSFSNINISPPQTTQPTRQPFPSLQQPTPSPTYQQTAASQYQNPFLSSNSNKNAQSSLALKNLMNTTGSAQQMLPSPPMSSLAQRPANNIFGLTPPPSTQIKKNNIFQSSFTPQPQQTSNFNNSPQQTSPFNNMNGAQNTLEQKANQPLLPNAQRPLLQNSQQFSMQNVQAIKSNFQPVQPVNQIPQLSNQSAQYSNQNTQFMNQNLQSFNNSGNPFNHNLQQFNQNTQQTQQQQAQPPFINNTQQSVQNRQQLPLQNTMNLNKMNNNMMQPQNNNNNMQPQTNNLNQLQSNLFSQQYTSPLQSRSASNQFNGTQINHHRSHQPNSQTFTNTPQQSQQSAPISDFNNLTGNLIGKHSQLNLLDSFIAANPMPIQPSQLETELDPEQTLDQLCQQLVAQLKEAHQFLLSDIPLKYVDQIQQSRFITSKFKQLQTSMVPQSATIAALQALHSRQDMIESELDWLNDQFGPGSHQHPISELLQASEQIQQIIDECEDRQEQGQGGLLQQIYESLAETENAILAMQPMLSVLEERLRFDN